MPGLICPNAKSPWKIGWFIVEPSESCLLIKAIFGVVFPLHKPYIQLLLSLGRRQQCDRPMLHWWHTILFDNSESQMAITDSTAFALCRHDVVTWSDLMDFFSTCRTFGLTASAKGFQWSLWRSMQIQATWKWRNLPSLKLTANAPEDGWLKFLLSFWGPAYFQGRTVSLRECIYPMILEERSWSPGMMYFPTKWGVIWNPRILNSLLYPSPTNIATIVYILHV